MGEDDDDFVADLLAKFAPPPPPEISAPESDDFQVEEMLAGMPVKPMSVLQVHPGFEHLVDKALEVQTSTAKLNIYNPFDDGGLRTAILCSMLGLHVLRGKGGNDAADDQGNSYELKSINRLNSDGDFRGKDPGVTTGRDLTPDIIDRYRRTSAWIVGLFHGVVPQEVWVIPSAFLETHFQAWEGSARNGKPLNNPKIPMKYVREFGTRVYLAPSSV